MYLPRIQISLYRRASVLVRKDRLKLHSNEMRPSGLPEFENPPLNEVAMGVQFTPAPKYSQIYAREVWRLFETEYPNVSEQPPLSPMFETFGLSRQPQFQFGLGNAAQHDRFWFASPDNSKLLQFQPDRFHLNWRAATGIGEAYPRFDTLIKEFEEKVSKLQLLMERFGTQTLTCNQVELSYINHIATKYESAELSPISILDFNAAQLAAADDFNLIYRKVLSDIEGKPKGRLTVECGTALDAFGMTVLVLNLTVRGAPDQPRLKETIEFLKDARVKIVNEFNDITTSTVHKIWGKIES